MFTFELDIDDFATPVYGGDWIEIPNENVVISGVTNDVKKYNDEVFKRVELNGSLKINGVVYDALKSLSVTYSKVKIRLKKSGVVKATAWLDIRQDIDEDGSISLHDTTPIDKYTNVLQGYDKKQDILQVGNIKAVRVTKNVEYDTIRSPVSLPGTPVIIQSTENCSLSLWSALQALISPPLLTDIKSGSYSSPYRNVKTDITQLSCAPPVGNSTRSTLVVTTWQRQIKWIAEVGGDFESPGSAWVDTGETKTIGTRNYKKFATEPYSSVLDYQIEYETSTKSNYFLVDLDSIEDSVTYTRMRDIRDVIEFCVTNLDSTIIFDNLSFPYFDQVSDYNNIYIQTMSDALLTAAGQQKSNGATRSEFILKDFLEWLRHFKIYWYIDDDNRFIIDSKSNLNAIVTTFDATNYDGRNWTTNNNKYQFDTDKIHYKELINSTATNLDFISQTVEFPRLENIGDSITTNLLSFHTDILDIQSNPGQYNDSISEFNLLAVRDKTTVDFLVKNVASGDRYGSYLLSGFSWDNTTKTFIGTATGEGAVHTNPFDGIKGHTLNISLSFTVFDGASTDLRIRKTSDDTIVYFETLSTGQNTITYEFTSTESYYLEIFKGAGSGLPAVMVVQSWQVYDEDEQEVIVSTGAVSGSDIANAPLSLANMLEQNYLVDLPDNQIAYNEQTVTLDPSLKLKSKIQNIKVSLLDIDTINKDGVITDLGTGELIEASISLSGETAKIKIRNE